VPKRAGVWTPVRWGCGVLWGVAFASRPSGGQVTGTRSGRDAKSLRHTGAVRCGKAVGNSPMQTVIACDFVLGSGVRAAGPSCKVHDNLGSGSKVATGGTRIQLLRAYWLVPGLASARLVPRSNTASRTQREQPRLSVTLRAEEQLHCIAGGSIGRVHLLVPVLARISACKD
jgi:hypothetical protein